MSEEKEVSRPVSEPEPEKSLQQSSPLEVVEDNTTADIVSEPELEPQDPTEHWMFKKGLSRDKKK